MTSLTRGPHSARVYWRRRAALVLTVLVLVVAVLGVVRDGGAGGAGEDPDVTAAPAGGTSSPSPTATASPGATPGTPEGPEAPTQAPSAQPTPTPTPTPEPLATPVGWCDNADVLVTPQVVDAVAGRTVTLAFSVGTATTEACTWRMSAQHLAVTLTRDSGDRTGEVWSTRQCPGTVPEQDVVLRREVLSTVTLAWDGRVSARGCPAQRQWAEPGELQVAAAAYGGQPAEVDLELRSPTAADPAPVPQGQGTTPQDGTGGAGAPTPGQT